MKWVDELIHDILYKGGNTMQPIDPEHFDKIIEARMEQAKQALSKWIDKRCDTAKRQLALDSDMRTITIMRQHDGYLTIQQYAAIKRRTP